MIITVLQFTVFISSHVILPLCCCFCINKVLSYIWIFCDPVNCSPPGFSVHGISQARILGLVATSFSRGSFQTRDRMNMSCIAGGSFTTEIPVVVQSLSRVWLFEIPQSVAHQASLSFMITWSLLKLMSIESMMPLGKPVILLCYTVKVWRKTY